uniref:Uncharacterized protein LOC114342089 isoform X2 n=1 Tax=Diabrotica virgifera virgifera TaxID=50390 RepID=A0A6P7GTJ8_DIAVI
MSNVLDENFFYNSMLAKAMVTLLPPNERKMMRCWFDKMLELDKTEKQKEIRNEYMWFMLLMLQVRKVREPFNKVPPNVIGDLRDLVLRCHLGNLFWMVLERSPMETLRTAAGRLVESESWVRN